MKARRITECATNRAAQQAATSHHIPSFPSQYEVGDEVVSTARIVLKTDRMANLVDNIDPKYPKSGDVICVGLPGIVTSVDRNESGQKIKVLFKGQRKDTRIPINSISQSRNGLEQYSTGSHWNVHGIVRKQRSAQDRQDQRVTLASDSTLLTSPRIRHPSA